MHISAITFQVCLLVWQSPTALESSLVSPCKFWVFATCPTLRGSTVSHVGVARVSKNCFHCFEELLESAPPPPQKEPWNLAVPSGCPRRSSFFYDLGLGMVNWECWFLSCHLLIVPCPYHASFCSLLYYFQRMAGEWYGILTVCARNTRVRTTVGVVSVKFWNFTIVLAKGCAHDHLHLFTQDSWSLMDSIPFRNLVPSARGLDLNQAFK